MACRHTAYQVSKRMRRQGSRVKQGEGGDKWTFANKSLLKSILTTRRTTLVIMLIWVSAEQVWVMSLVLEYVDTLGERCWDLFTKVCFGINKPSFRPCPKTDFVYLSSLLGFFLSE